VTQVVIIGGGPAGMTTANLLQQAGVDCVVLELRNKSYVEDRQRAGLLDHHSASVFDEAGLGVQILGNSQIDTQYEFRIDGESHFLDVPAIAGRSGRIVPQQLVVQRLLATYLDNGGDLRFEVRDVGIHDLATDQPRVTYRDRDGVYHELACSYIAGCDGRHGVSRRSIPEDELVTYSLDHGVCWYTMLAEAPAPRYPLMAVSPDGFAAQFARGPHASRFYLQYRPDEDPCAWTDEYAWELLRLRLGDESLGGAPFTGREVIEMRSHVTEPMSYRRLYLLGDAAHIITPMGAKGMNLAIADAAVFARAVIAAERDNNDEALAAYSPTCLHRTWDYQAFSRSFLEMMHDAGDDSRVGPFRRRLARANFNRLMASPPGAAAFADLMIGAPLVRIGIDGSPA
jgi:p-hydroxybenzoate 3-monooxygenase